MTSSGTAETVVVKWEVGLSKTFLRIPYVKQKPLDFERTEASFFQNKVIEYHTDKMPHIVISNALIVTDNDGAGKTLERILECQNEWPTQFGMCFITEDTLRGRGFYQKEKLEMKTSGITKVQIKIAGVDIFHEGPMDWRNNVKTNKMIWQTQMDYSSSSQQLCV